MEYLSHAPLYVARSIPHMLVLLCICVADHNNHVWFQRDGAKKPLWLASGREMFQCDSADYFSLSRTSLNALATLLKCFSIFFSPDTHTQTYRHEGITLPLLACACGVIRTITAHHTRMSCSQELSSWLQEPRSAEMTTTETSLRTSMLKTTVHAPKSKGQNSESSGHQMHLGLKHHYF